MATYPPTPSRSVTFRLDSDKQSPGQMTRDSKPKTPFSGGVALDPFGFETTPSFPSTPSTFQNKHSKFGQSSQIESRTRPSAAMPKPIKSSLKPSSMSPSRPTYYTMRHAEPVTKKQIQPPSSTPSSRHNKILYSPPAPERPPIMRRPVPSSAGGTSDGFGNQHGSFFPPKESRAQLPSFSTTEEKKEESFHNAPQTPSNPKPSRPTNASPKTRQGPVRKNSGSKNTDDDENDAESWRKHGKLYRAKLVLLDEEKGGNSFVLSSECSIDRYYRVAESVLEQFLSTSIREANELIESYLVGNRLVKFLSVVLPTHSEYFSGDSRLEAMRQRSQSQLVELLQYMEELALLIDEMQYNKYILNDLTPDVKTVSSEWTASTNDSTLTSEGSDKENNTIDTAVTSSSMSMEEKVAFVVTNQEQLSFGSNDFTGSTHRDFVGNVFTKMKQSKKKKPSASQVSTQASTQSTPIAFAPAPSTEWQATFDVDPPQSKSNIDLLLSEEPPKQNETPKSIPKLKGPPTAIPRSLRAEVAKSVSPRAPPSDFELSQSCFADPWNPRKSQSATDTALAAFKDEMTARTKIEQRWEQAQMQSDFEMNRWNEDIGRYKEDGSLTTSSSPRRLLHHFKGCVRCLLE